jgi:hypothetical protein
MFVNHDMIPHVWFFSINILLTLLFANADINSRVASTCPYYYWAVADLIVNLKQHKGLASFALLHNVLYLLLNLLLFTMEVGFL